ncbi:MAG: serpin family protein [Phycisphaerales bacterium]|nr:serpin family protein [Phycisphaerales bacterium]MCB9864850.1 serpin family protein [Phycisphaerales bacterium]
MPRAIVIALGTLIIAISGICGLSAEADQPKGKGASMNADEKNSHATPKSDNAAVRANNAFGLELYRAIAAKAGEKNIFVSPYSMSVALTMTAEGARNETYTEMANVLRFPVEDAAGRRGITAVHQGYTAMRRRFADAAGNANEATRKQIDALRKRLDDANNEATSLQRGNDWRAMEKAQKKAQKIADELNELLTQVDRFDLRSANALWVDKHFPLLNSYVDTIDRFYASGGVTSLDIQGDTERSRRRINGWVEDNTEKRIKDLIPKGDLSPDAGLVITNAVYFLGQWSDPFEKGETRDEDFTLVDGAREKVKLMRDPWRKGVPYAAFNGDGSYFDTPAKVQVNVRDQIQTYPDDDGFSMIELPYKGDELTMTLIAPRRPDGLPAIEAKLSAETLDTWLSKLNARQVKVALPRFRLEADYSMGDVLQAMGMKRAFTSPAEPDGADFSGMSGSSDPREQLFIGAVLHKAFVEVNEEGTEAAAATAVVMIAGAAAPSVEMVPFVPEFRADRPFLFLIRDSKTGIILFVGRMMRPVEQ